MIKQKSGGQTFSRNHNLWALFEFNDWKAEVDSRIPKSDRAKMTNKDLRNWEFSGPRHEIS